MRRLFIVILFLICNKHCIGQISAPYLSLYISKEGKTFWQPMHKMPAGDFKLTWLKNGNVNVHFNKYDSASTYFLEKNLKSKGFDKIEKNISGFSLKGIYFDPNQPPEYYYAIYINPGMTNSILLELHAMPGNIVSASYFSDIRKNPFQKRIYHNIR